MTSGRGGELRLAPLYDIASFLPYAKHGIRKLTLAMKIGGTYRVHEVGVYAWQKLAAELGRGSDEVIARIAESCAALPDLAARVLKRTSADGLAHPDLAVLAAKIQQRAAACARALRRA